MTSPANERGGHARPRRPFAPRPRHHGGRGHNGAPDATPDAPDATASAPGVNGAPGVSNGAPGPNGAAPGPDTGVPIPLSSPPMPDGHPSVPDGHPPYPRAVGLCPTAARPGRTATSPYPATARPGRTVVARPARTAARPCPAAARPSPAAARLCPVAPRPCPTATRSPRTASRSLRTASQLAPDGFALAPDGLAPGPVVQNGPSPSTPPASPAPPFPSASSAPPVPSAPEALQAPRPRRDRPARLASGSRAARHVAPSTGRPGRKASATARRAKRSRIAAAAIVAVGVLVIGLATGFGSELSAEPTAQSFLLAWQQQQYDAAGALTTAPAATVAAELRGAVAQLDTAQLFLSMKSVVRHGGTAEASFTATVDLAQQGRVWTYQGHFGLRRVGGNWKVVWAPSVINPNLGPGERLAVVTTFPNRAAVLDDKGNPLQLKAPAYVLGVMPDHLASPADTARAFAKYTSLQAGQVLGQITAAPPHSFLRLATLDSITYARLRPSLRSVPGLMVRTEPQLLFQAKATGLVGDVGSEIDKRLRADGALYAPGTTVGLSGLERRNPSAPSCSQHAHDSKVIAVNSTKASRPVSWPNAPARRARRCAPRSTRSSAERRPDRPGGRVQLVGEIVAVRASTSGDVLAVAQHQVSGALLPADGALNAEAGRRAPRSPSCPRPRWSSTACPRPPRSRARVPSTSRGGPSPVRGPASRSRSALPSPRAAARRSRSCLSGSRRASGPKWSGSSASAPTGRSCRCRSSPGRCLTPRVARTWRRRPSAMATCG